MLCRSGGGGEEGKREGREGKGRRERWRDARRKSSLENVENRVCSSVKEV